MRSYSLIAPAKINLYLEIIGDRPDGYHELAMVLQGIDLADRIDLNANGVDQFRLHCDHPEVPADESNLAYKAALLMAAEFPDAFEQYGGVNITIHKHIPVGAGLAGGSTNGAAVLVGLDLIWGLGLTQGELQDLAAKLGSDVPFCIAGGTAIATGRGEQLSPLPSINSLYAVLAKYRSLSVSTVWAYQTYRKQFGDSYSPVSTTGSAVGTSTTPKQRAHAGEIVAAIMHHDSSKIGKLLHNDLEKVVLPAHPQVAQLRETIQQFNPLGTMMSGSGPTVFALAESQAEAKHLQQQIQAALPDPDLQTWVTQFRAGGIQIV
ncbi:4-(cytidine 5'-diphospho)-2-C-methyl-D-erythritol kinase [Leptolyngbya sp. FACHB-541]|uniref:4-(cytidine 5'-diphospho)-2-C-methyl-D-erythritol kinase n=1 Tax=Leptolyngbya sp. FACHB-541 TaxID=2692810 RepID=UPI001685E617|nr:4-(cytidine 5'-diphospho)-2-C-methyl-D-erythritol kinase [Leptolyngbya sp. FACHB-541]MBD1998331.1 4-(cytidine 5'-diphospho)-2-C-methyl-D-erythritol kinase [Leptolyngbya sp. FACHB-541]